MAKEMKKQEILLERTRKGLPALWEQGGGYSNTGEAQIIANPDGSPKKPVYIRRRGELANREHALFVVEKGDIVILSNHHRRDFHHRIFRIAMVEEEEATLELVAEYSAGEWSGEEGVKIEKEIDALMEGQYIDVQHDLSPLLNAVLNAEGKATCYHCREPHHAAKTE